MTQNLSLWKQIGSLLIYKKWFNPSLVFFKENNSSSHKFITISTLLKWSLYAQTFPSELAHVGTMWGLDGQLGFA